MSSGTQSLVHLHCHSSEKCKVRAFFVLEEERTFSYWILEPNHRLSAELARG